MWGIWNASHTAGAAGVLVLAGWLGQSYGWRQAFYLLGFPGLVLALFVFLLREPARGRTEVAAARYGRDDWKILLRSVPLRYLYAGYAMFGIAANVRSGTKRPAGTDCSGIDELK